MVVDGSVRLELPDGHQWIPRLVEAFPDRIESITLGKPTLEDVFIHFTGHRFWTNESVGRFTTETRRTQREEDSTGIAAIAESFFSPCPLCPLWCKSIRDQ